MIKAEHIHDALTLLSDDLLISADSLRRKKPFRWQPIAALAACACVAAGLWLFAPGADSVANGGASMELSDRVEAESTTAKPLEGIITQVSEDFILVIPNGCTQTVTVSFENLELIPPFFPGQSVRIYCEEDLIGAITSEILSPYRIEVNE